MTTIPVSNERPEAPLFCDGIGDRVVAADGATGELLQILRIRPALTAVPSFEFALRERAARLANFRHAYYARVRRVDRVQLPGPGLAIVSDHVEGTRLSDILRVAHETRIQLDINAALCLIRQLVPAVALLHENARDVAHGLIAPERLIITPHARLVIVEHVIAGAIEQLQFPRERLWQEFRIAMPSSAGLPRFDHRADVTGVGLVALALLLGRPLAADEFPHRLPHLLNEARERTALGEERPLSQALRDWLARAMQLDGRRAFASAPEALSALEELVADDSMYVAAPVALETFLSRYIAAVLEPPPIQGQQPPVDPAFVAQGHSQQRGSAPHQQPPAPRPVPVAAAAHFSAFADETFPSSHVHAPKPEPAPVRRVTEFAEAVTTKPAPVPAPVPHVAAPVQPAPVQPVQAPAPPPVQRPAPVHAAQPAYTPVPQAPAPVHVAAPGPPAAATLPPQVSHPPVQAASPPPQPAAPSIADLIPVADLAPAPAEKRALFDPDNPFTTPAKPEHARAKKKLSKRLIVSAAAVLLILVTAGFVAPKFIGTSVAPIPQMGTLVVESNPSGVQVFVDGIDKGPTPANVSVTPGAHILELRGRGVPRVIPFNATAGGQISHHVEFANAPEFGSLRVESQPAGAKVLVDGVDKGAAPLTVADLTPGDHEVVLQSGETSARHVVSVQAGATASLVVPLAIASAAPAAGTGPVSGWLSVKAPFSIEIREEGRVIGTTDADRIMMAAGRHEVQLVNETLGYRVTRVVNVQPGKVASLTAELPNGTVNLNAAPWAEVFIDGQRVGETPIGNLSVPIGPHEVVFRHPQFGEKRHAISVTLSAPVRLSVDMK
jgi:hypothetical protein